MRFFSNIIPLLIVFVAVLLIFYKGLFNFYFQDDFIHLTLAWVTSASDLVKLIEPIEYFPYRPIAIQLLSFIAVHIFNLNPIPAHLLLFVLHGINIVLLWRVLDEVFSQKLAKFVVIFLYAVSSIHFMLLYWWSILFMLLGTTFFLFSFLILQNYKRKPTTFKMISYFVFFFLMLITNEALFIFPVFIAFYSYLFKQKHIKRLALPSFLFSIAFVFLRIYFVGYPLSSDYRIGNLVEVIMTFKWYFFRALNLPEGIKMMSKFTQKSILSLFTVVWGLSFFMFLKSLRYLRREDFTKFLFGISWYLVFAFPFFLLPNHISPYYLNTALIGFFIALSSVCFISIHRVCGKKPTPTRCKIVILTLFLYGFLSYLNVDFLHKTHWVVWRAEIARNYIKKTKKMHSSLPKGTTVVFQNTKTDSSEIAVALSGNKALRLYYKDPSLQVVYGDSSLQNAYVVSD